MVITTGETSKSYCVHLKISNKIAIVGNTLITVTIGFTILPSGLIINESPAVAPANTKEIIKASNVLKRVAKRAL